MNRTPLPNDGERTPAQISDDLLARMARADQRHGENGPGKSVPDDIPENVDFESVLKSVSPAAARSLATDLSLSGRQDAPARGPRDRNLSSIIEMIRDEGPAGEDVPLQPADDVLEIEAKENQEQAAGKTGEEQAPSSEDAPPLRKPGKRAGVGPFFTTALAVLLLGVIALGFLFWQQYQRQQDLQEQLGAARQMMTLMDERQRALEARFVGNPGVTGNLVRREELTRVLEEQQRNIAGELSLFTAMLLPALQSLSPSEDPGERSVAVTGHGVSEAQPPSAEKRPALKKPADKAAAGGKQAKKKVVSADLAKKAVQSMTEDRRQGGWLVYLRSFTSEKSARKALEDLADRLPQAVVRKARVRGKPVWRLTVAGLASKKEALAFRANAKGNLGFPGAWIARDR